MASRRLDGVRVAILAMDGFEQVELTRPRAALEKHGAEVEVISLHPGSIRGVHSLFQGDSVKVDRTIFTASPDRYDALLIPGGLVSPDLLRQSKRIRRFVRRFDEEGKPIAVICHGPWLLVSAGLVEGRRLTSWPGIRDDVENAGGIWENRSVVRDDNWISSRGPHDLLQFNREMVKHFSPDHEASGHRQPLPGAGLLLGAAVLGVGALLARRLLGDGGHNEERPRIARVSAAIHGDRTGIHSRGHLSVAPREEAGGRRR
jgi:protease I